MWSFYIILLARSILRNFFGCFGFWLHLFGFVVEIGTYTQPYDCSTIWFGWSLRRSLVQHRAQCRVSGEVRPGCSGLSPLCCWKPPRMETAQPFWAPCSSVLPSSWHIFVSSRWKSFSYTQSEAFLFQFMPAVSCPSVMHHCEEPSWLPPCRRLLVGHPEAVVSPGWRRPAPSASPHGAGAPDHLGAPPLNSFQFVDVFPVWGSPQLGAAF